MPTVGTTEFPDTVFRYELVSVLVLPILKATNPRFSDREPHSQMSLSKSFVSPQFTASKL